MTGAGAEDRTRAIVEVRFFAAAAEAVGARDGTLRRGDARTAGELLDAIVHAWPALAPLRGVLALGTDERLLAPGDVVPDDEGPVAVLPPVSGG